MNRVKGPKLKESRHFTTHTERHSIDFFEGPSLEALGRRLSLTRRVYGLAQKDFCAKAGLPTNTYNQYEKGKKRPTIENAIALCEHYDLTLDWIYRGVTTGLRFGIADAIKSLRASTELID